MKPSTEVSEPKLRELKTANYERNLANSRNDGNEPKWTKSNTDIGELGRAELKAVDDIPSIATWRDNKDEPE